MKRLYIFGDSFATSIDSVAWTTLLNQYFEVYNYSTNGSSQYRIWKNYQLQKHNILVDDIVLFCHTSPSRIFLKDSYISKTRKLHTHPNCDILIGNTYAADEKELISVLEKIWDDDFFEDTYQLYLQNLLLIPNSYHVTFFEHVNIENNFNSIWQNYPGTINHLNALGNRQVLDSLRSILVK